MPCARVYQLLCSVWLWQSSLLRLACVTARRMGLLPLCQLGAVHIICMLLKPIESPFCSFNLSNVRDAANCWCLQLQPLLDAFEDLEYWRVQQFYLTLCSSFLACTLEPDQEQSRRRRSEGTNTTDENEPRTRSRATHTRRINVNEMSNINIMTRH